MSIQSDLTSDLYKPAPNIYNPDYTKLKQHNPDYSIKNKYPSGPSNKNPAPNAYKPEKILPRAPDFSMSSKYDSPFKNTVPGPGTYEVDAFKQLKYQQPIRTIAPKYALKTNFQGPSPADYTPNSIQESAPAYSFTSRPAENLKNMNPGPGAYDPNAVFTQAPSFSMGIKLGSERTNENPAPNAYELPPTAKSISVQIPRVGHLPIAHANGVPGPNEYQSLSETPGRQFSMRFKHYLGDRNSNPGPGAYNSKFEYTEPNPKTNSMSFKHQFGRPDVVPGPGTYETVSVGARSAPRFSIGQKLSGFERDRTPAGNEYQQILTQQPNCGFKFNRQSRVTKTTSTTGKLGPGGYNIDRSLNQQGVYFHERHRTGKPDSVPGPGAYDWNSSTLSTRGPSIHLKTKRAWRTE
ncbi:SHIPPO 1-like protein [Spironucleus salmonicida]|uniref:SHIPPO 1-like protein n=1 Tax=Spironucleus salmonicida TaxID=348837 RepID=V6LTR4_9EUKA|nr:SHIPPO 1-like protein [Spironucleus salmonicida]|eukprot:EST47096.1 SHIPPO 1-like protein [Spironucleus salmonicida]